MLYLGSPTSQLEIAAIFAGRRYQLGLSSRAADDLSGCQEGWVAKVECGVKSIGPMSFQAIAGALGLRWVVHDGRLHLFADDEALPAMTRRLRGSCRSRPVKSRVLLLLSSAA